MTCIVTWGDGDLKTWMLLRTMSESVVLLQEGSVLKSTLCVATKSHSDPWGWGYNP